jgi:hypothetical protein
MLILLTAAHVCLCVLVSLHLKRVTDESLRAGSTLRYAYNSICGPHVCVYVRDLNTWANLSEKNPFPSLTIRVPFTVSLNKSLLQR